MQLNVGKELSALHRMTVRELQAKYANVFGEPTNGRHKAWLIKRIIWRLQAQAEGDLSERARQRAMELANDADLRMTIPRQPKPAADAAERTIALATKVQPSTELMPGTMLERVYRGRIVRVMVLDGGFECEGQRYRSLTAIAKVVTGQHWNGLHFFGLRKRGGNR